MTNTAQAPTPPPPEGRAAHPDHLGHVIFITASAAMGGFLFGYDSSVINGAVEAIRDRYDIGSATLAQVIAIALINVDENLGANALGLTVMIVLAAAMVTHHYPMDMSFLRNYLLLALLALIVFSIVRLLMNIPRWLQRIGALFGVTLFTTYLLYDFDMLAAKQAAGINTWQAATHMAIELYLDIINLLLELLDALSD